MIFYKKAAEANRTGSFFEIIFEKEKIPETICFRENRGVDRI